MFSAQTLNGCSGSAARPSLLKKAAIQAAYSLNVGNLRDTGHSAEATPPAAMAEQLPVKDLVAEMPAVEMSRPCTVTSTSAETPNRLPALHQSQVATASPSSHCSPLLMLTEAQGRQEISQRDFDTGD